jgi:hypothetical protein
MDGPHLLIEQDAVLLKLLVDKFSLTPWENVEERLNQLNQQFLPLLQFAQNEP